MIHPKCIVPECNADTFFVELVLNLPPKAPRHQHGKPNVLKYLDEVDLPKAVGIIDRDPGTLFQPTLSSYGYQLKPKEGSSEFLRFYEHENKKYFLIEIDKKFEYWIYHKVIKEAPIVPSDYGIPNDWKGFYGYFKTKEIRTKGRVRQFFTALIDSTSPSLQTYISWIEECTR